MSWAQKRKMLPYYDKISVSSCLVEMYIKRNFHEIENQVVWSFKNLKSVEFQPSYEQGLKKERFRQKLPN